MTTKPNCIIVLGPTASGKTRLAVNIANRLNGAILSFDSRQVYRKLNIGTGKDLNEYQLNDKHIPYYLIDCCDIETHFHSYDFIQNYIAAYRECETKKQLPILAGGTGLYFDLVLKKHQYINIPNNESLRIELQDKGHEQLILILQSYDSINTEQADTSTSKRTIRAIEIADFLSKQEAVPIHYPSLQPIIFGINLSASERKLRIRKRLMTRIDEGLIEEVASLLNDGISAERLHFLGLEYTFITSYLTGKYDLPTMIDRLQTAILQYSKRQMTWFRKMEREGNYIHWINGNDSLSEQLSEVEKQLKNYPI